MGSQQPVLAVAPQQELPTDFTRSAACPYFSLTTSLIAFAWILLAWISLGLIPASVGLMNNSPIYKCGQFVRVSLPCCECSTLRKGTAAALAGRECWRCSGETSLAAGFLPSPRFSTFRDGARASNSESPVRPEYPPPPDLRDAPTEATA